MNYSIWIILFTFISYFIITDESIARFFILFGQLIKIKYEMLKWRIIDSPDNPIVRWKIHRNSLRIAKELKKEFDEKNKNN
jgi:hypothetical protein